MSKRKKKSSDKDNIIARLLLITAVIELISSIIELLNLLR